MSALAKLYAKAVKTGKRTYESVPKVLKEQVKEILIADGYGYLVEEDNGDE